MELSFSLDTIKEAALAFWHEAKTDKVFAFHGEMGAGKTTFIRALCEAKGVKGHVSSPTFSIINEYEYDCEGTKRVLFHMDLYRLKDEEEAIQAGVEDCLYSGHTCLVEWPEKAPGIFPPGTADVYMAATDSATRKLRIERK
ncbi:MAG TPA: tRNA (adenosine(37)-N6)-threonylcarbamoyltransferase complex ATPase subunit type 1 TsaE [Chitinophagaceae bacterium]|mgnify:CR=1 FL=1|nr:tRNA (adenosine(37)-N6)-threonylcarbamoyltransferase complex ATPase subunit type 1 TsaE [Chitinophagaceae bacterium]